MKIEMFDKPALYRNLTTIVGVAVILYGCLIVLKPFFPAFLVAFVFCLSTWPAFTWLQKRMGYSTGFAASLMTILMAVCFVVPLVFLGTSLAESFRSIVSGVIAMVQNSNGQAPPWMHTIPFVGGQLEHLWLTYVADSAHLAQTMREHAKPISEWLIEFGASIGHAFVEMSLGVVIAFFFFHDGTRYAEKLGIFLEKFSGAHGAHLVQVSVRTVMGVVYGIMGTALVLGALATIGFLISGVPAAPLLGLLTFFLGIIPGGPPVVLVPAVLWLLYKGQIAMAIFLGIWSAGIITVLDLVIRPYLISRGSRMPLLLVLFGVLGGVISFGFVGLFIGPALLAIGSSLFAELSQSTVPVSLPPPAEPQKSA